MLTFFYLWRILNWIILRTSTDCFPTILHISCVWSLIQLSCSNNSDKSLNIFSVIYLFASRNKACPDELKPIEAMSSPHFPCATGKGLRIVRQENSIVSSDVLCRCPLCSRSVHSPRAARELIAIVGIFTSTDAPIKIIRQWISSLFSCRPFPFTC